MASIYDPRDQVTLNNIQAFLDVTRGQITIGQIPPLERAALAAEGTKVRAALVGHVDEGVLDLLLRLDAALDHFSRTRVAIDEVLPEIKRRQQKP
jgi:hypothetical protein